MCNLKLLILGNLDLPLGLDCLSEGLIYLEWMEFPLKELPLGIQLDKLVELIMRHSKIQQLWHGIQVKILYFVQWFLHSMIYILVLGLLELTHIYLLSFF